MKAHATSTDAEYKYQSLIPDYERFTYVCGAYEGSLDETREMWRVHASTYERTITQNNALVTAVKVWLGSDLRNPGRQVQPDAFLAELKLAGDMAGLDIKYKEAANLGQHVRIHKKALRVVGLDFVQTRRGRDYIFHRSQDTLEECVSLYTSLEKIAAKRRGTTFRVDFSSSGPKPQSDFRDFRDFKNEPVMRDVSDL